MSLAPGAQAAFDAANADYKAMPGKLLPQISITEARRSVFVQADYSEKDQKFKLFGGVKANPADFPGQSTHQYGVAVDIVIKPDPTRIGKAMADNGWTATHSNEAWHFDATGTADYTSAQAVIATLAPHFNEWGRTLKEVLVIEHGLPKQQQQVAVLTNRANMAVQKAKKAQQDVKQLAQKVKLADQRIKLAEKKVESTVLEVKQLYKDWQNLTFKCPNGYKWEDCDHDDLKADYLKEKARREDRWRAAQDKLNALAPELASLRARLAAETLRLTAGQQLSEQLTEAAKAMIEELKQARQLLTADRFLAAEGRQRMAQRLALIAAGVANGP
jgi:hypothetical protein